MKRKDRILCVLLQGVDLDSAVRRFAEACFRFTPQIAIREGEAVFLEIGKCLSLFSEEGLAARVQVLAKRFGMSVSIGFAGSPGEALALARFPEAQEAHRLPLEAMQDCLSPFQ